MQSLLAEAPDLGDSAERLARLLGEDGVPESLDVFPVHAEQAAPPARVTAVDGSSAVVADARAFLVGAWRAGALTVRGIDPDGQDFEGRAGGAWTEGPATRRVTPVTARVLLRGEAAHVVEQALRAAGHPAPGVHPDLRPEAAVEALRGVTELVVAREAVDALHAGDVLLVDGALQAHEPASPRVLVEGLLDAARARGVHVVGVCKSTSQTIGGLPALRVAAKAFTKSGPGTCAAELPRPNRGALARVFAARLSAAEPWLFRFDVSPAPGAEPADVLAAVASVCGHPAYPGYPSPLAMVHHAVVLDEGLQREVEYALRRAAEDAGADAAAWDLAFTDYHDVLDLGR